MSEASRSTPANINNQPKNEASVSSSADAQAKDLPVWECEFNSLKEPWTVGDKQTLECRGDYIERLNDTAQVRFSEAEWQYSLHVLEVKNSDHTQASFLVTGYKPGSHKGEFVISDGKSGFKAPALQWHIESVISEGVMAQPFGPMGPFKLAMPWWFWGAIALSVILIAVALITKISRYVQRRRLLESLSVHASALGAYNQFNKDVRQLTRQLTTPGSQLGQSEYISQLEQSFRLYLVREYTVPALEWPQRAILKDLKSRHKKTFTEAGGSIKRLLKEFEKARREQDKLTAVDSEQLTIMVRKTVDELNHVQKGRT